MATKQDARDAAEIARRALAEANKAHTTVRLDAWRSVFEKTNRILSGRALRVRIIPQQDVPTQMETVPGWSDGETIHFNGPLVEDMLRMKDAMGAVLRLKGLNYHELSHVLFTPRQSEELPRRVLEKAAAEGSSWWYAMNALEDQRIETWFTASYGPSRRYFEAAVLQWLITDGNAEAAVLLHGRKYLPAKIRVQAERVFVKKYSQDLMDRFKVVIDDYLTVVLPTDSVRGFMVVTRYHALLKEMQAIHSAQLPKLPVEDNGVSHGTPGKDSCSVGRTGRVSAKEAKDASAAAKKATEKAKVDDAKAKADLAEQRKKDAEAKAGEQPGEGDSGAKGDKPGAGESQQADGEGSEGDGDGDGQGNGQGGGQGDGTPSGQSSDQQGAGGGSGGSGAGSDPGGPHEIVDDADLSSAIKDMMEAVNDGMDDIADDAAVQADVKRVLDAVKAVVNNGKQDAAGVLVKGTGAVPPATEHLVAMRRVKTLITQIRQAVEPNILHRQMNGRIDPRRIVSRRPNEMDVFKSYDEGAEDETGMEAVVLCDISGSMGGQMEEASGALWVMKRAFDSLGIRCTVLAFDTEHYIVYQPGEKAKPQVSVISSRGGTDPTSALQQAHLIFTKSHQPSKVLVTITDGQWGGNDDEVRGLMKSMHQHGVTSMLLGLGAALRHYGKHDHMIGHDLSSISDMPKAVSKVVGQIMRTKTGQV